MSNYFEAITTERIVPKEDIDWINFIFQYLIDFYKQHKDDKSFKDKSENQITEKIYIWLKNEINFTRTITVNSQPRTDNMEIEGYYDLKFESSLWNQGQSHFAIENKILKNTETSYKDYIYYPNKAKGEGENKKIFDDGGMFRFLSNKYADKQCYGGMLAFVKENNIIEINDNLKNKVKNIKILEYGQLINETLLGEKILDFQNSFQSNHIRKDDTNIHLFHLQFYFRNH